MRQLLSRSLRGNGIEIGPGDAPFPLPFGGAHVRYVDRWDVSENTRLFAEIPDARFVEPHFQVDLNADRLAAFADDSQDFVIASHVLEHLVEPLGQLEDIHRVLKPGGVALILLPDRRRTFDRNRKATPLEHLCAEYRDGVRTLDDAHIEEFVAHVPEDWGDDPPRDRAEQFQRHRDRSIHVHCWSEDEFAEVVGFCISNLGMSWELVDRLRTDDVAGGAEFGLTLRKSTVALPASLALAQFTSVWEALGDRSRYATIPTSPGDVSGVEPTFADGQGPNSTSEVSYLRGQIDALRAELGAAHAVLARHEMVLGPLRRTGALPRAVALLHWVRRARR